MPVSKETLDQIALSPAEYDEIVQKLEREPNGVELGMFGALWSEHCGYKHSRPLLRGFPTTGAAVRVAAGQENAGVVDIGDGYQIVFKVESHNHPSAIEPHQGAATGVGGIVRDILAMGARPIALLNSLRFGPLTQARNRFLFHGVVSGISSYGNCIGVPDVGGEIMFAPCYSGNPLVNAMCIGLLKEGELVRAAAKTPGNTVMLVGSATGRDGIHGASGLASRTFEEEREMRPTVQVGDAFLEKVLIEACLEAARSGHLEGMQDLGAAGLTSSAIESAFKGGAGLDIDIALVPRRETGMTPYEIMLSESQERMLLIVKKGHEREIQTIFNKWDLHAVAIGTVTSTKRAKIYDGKELVVDLPIAELVEAPQYRTPSVRPAYLAQLHAMPLPVEPPEAMASQIVLAMLRSPNIASRFSVFRQYDHEVQTNTVLKPGQADAAVLRLRGTKKGIATKLDGNGRMVYLEPYMGGAMAVAEACRNVACTGATPIAITDCLNFGNPEKPEVYYQMEEAIRGMADACRALDVPVISGNVSLYNETQGQAIYPTPVVGAVGVMPDVEKVVPAGFRTEGDSVYLLGADTLDLPESTLAGSEYLAHLHNQVSGQPQIDLQMEARVQRTLIELIQNGIVCSAHDISDGGIAVTLAECIAMGQIGFHGDLPIKGRWDVALFNEAPSRIVVSLAESDRQRFEARASEAGVPFLRLGIATGKHLEITGLFRLTDDQLFDAYFNSLEKAARG